MKTQNIKLIVLFIYMQILVVTPKFNYFIKQGKRLLKNAKSPIKNPFINISNRNLQLVETLKDFNPLQLLLECENKFSEKDYGICDIDGLFQISDTMKTKLTELKNKGIYTYIYLTYGSYSSLELTWMINGFEIFMDDLLMYTGSFLNSKISSKNEDDALILYIGLTDVRQGLIAGKNVHEKAELDKNELDLIITRVLTKIKSFDFENVVEKLLDDAIYYTEHCYDCVSFWIGIIFFSVTGLCALIIIIVFIVKCIIGKQLISKEKKLIEKMSKFLQNYKNNSNTINQYCILCFEALNNNLNESQNMLNECKELPCGHYIHKICYDNWVVKEDENCPICIEKFESDEDPKRTLKKLADIHTRLNENFKDVIFSLDKSNNITYRFSEGFNMGDVEDDD